MFARALFAARLFAPRYFPGGSGTPPPPPTPGTVFAAPLRVGGVDYWLSFLPPA